MRRLFLILAGLLSVATAWGQRIDLIPAIDFATRFDNREWAENRIKDDSHTWFGMRVTPYVGLQWDKRNTFVFGADMFRYFGDPSTKFMTKIRPVAFYQFETDHVRTRAGRFHRSSVLMGRWGDAFCDPATSFYENQVQGFSGQYFSDHGFAELALNWTGLQTPENRERFRLYLAGEYRLPLSDAGTGMFYVGATNTLYHYAKTSAPVDGEAIVDYMLVNPYVGVWGEWNAWRVEATLGWLQTIQRDRNFENWDTPGGGQLTLKGSWKGLSLENMLYGGQGLMPYWDTHGHAVYSGSTMYSGDLYNRTTLAYDRSFFKKTLTVGAGLAFHYDGVGLGLQQVIRVAVNFQKPIHLNPKKSQ